MPVVAEHGYVHAKIADIAERAGISRATFYELFESKEQCVLTAHSDLSDGFLQRASTALADASEQQALEAGIRLLLDLARTDAAAFAFLTHEITLAGSRGNEQRERLLGRLVELVEQRSGGWAQLPDVPLRALLGGTARLVAMRARSADRKLPQLADLTAWSELYAGGAGAPRWQKLVADSAFARRVLELGPPEAFVPQSPPRGRHRLPAAVVRHVQRERILHGTAAAMSRKGYADTTVADIVATAGLSREVFYAHMGSRRQALSEATKLFFEQTFAAMAGAFFTAPARRPERVWAAGLALSRFLSAAPTFTRLALFESYAPDAAAARRADGMLLGFAMFVNAGFEPSRPGDTRRKRLPTLVPEAVVCAILETVAPFAHGEQFAELPGLVPLGAYLTLAPLSGVERANEFVERKMLELDAATPGLAP